MAKLVIRFKVIKIYKVLNIKLKRKKRKKNNYLQVQRKRMMNRDKHQPFELKNHLK